MTPRKSELNKNFIRIQNNTFMKKVMIKNCKKILTLAVLLLLLSVFSTGCISSSGKQSRKNRSGKSYVIKGKRYHILKTAQGYKETGTASWYGGYFHGRKTANGETYNMHGISAAHKTLPLNTWVEVRNLENNKKLKLRINDRGPFIDGRIIDLSYAAANNLGVYRPGIAKVYVRAITNPKEIKQLQIVERRN